MRLTLPFALALTLLVSAPPAHGDGPDDREAELVARARKSVAWLVGFKDGHEFRATGFVVTRPGDGKKVILTAGHIFHDKMVLSARLPGMRSPVECDLLDFSDKHDLMAVAPHHGDIDVPALPLLTAADPQPRLSDPVFTIGCPGGLDLSSFRGEINAEPIKAAELQEALPSPEVPGKMVPYGDTVLLRHSTFSFPGMSGGPVLDGRGRVIAVQIGTLPKASNVSFAVHAKHVGDLNLANRPRVFTGATVADSEIHNALTVERKAAPPVLIRLGDEEVDARCFHFGYVPADADTVLERYIQDKRRFLEFFTRERLRTLLDGTRVAHITNPTLGFRVLVPKGYAYDVVETQARTGVVVTFRSPDEAIPEPYRTITVRAFIDDEGYDLAEREASAGIKAGKYPLPKRYEDTPYYRTLWHRSVRDTKLLERAQEVFPQHILGIRLVDQQGKITGNPKDPLFRLATDSFSGDPSTAWERHNYDAVNGNVVHAVHYAVRENVTVIVHYQLLKKDRENFLAGNEVGKAFLERAFIASTVSLY